MSSEETEKEAAAGGGQEGSPVRDFLAEAVARAGLPPEAVETLTFWLEGQLREDQYTRLDQVRHGEEGGIPLARVFVDLAVGKWPNRGLAEEDEVIEEDLDEEAFVHEVLRCEPRPIALGSVDPIFQAESDLEEMRRPSSGFVLIGGPGQGKTTVGQFLCQVHRAALLAPRRMRLSDKGARALAGFLDQCTAGRLALPVTGAIPFPIVLRELAPWIEHTGQAEPGAMFRYLSEHIRRALDDAGRRDVPVLHPDQIRRVLAAGPSLVILDGLDEVPASAGRSTLLETIRGFLQTLADDGACGLVIATTRPQGYAGEFEGLRLEERHLAPLTRGASLRYAERLVSVRFGDRPDLRRKILDRLRQAANEDATARLMRSPLQVTLMATLVERIGRAPSERWSLFHDYYRIIYEREMERGGPLAEVLRTYRPYIDRIHARSALLLQVASERAEGAESLMSRTRLMEVIDAALAEEGIDRTEREALAGTILQATVERVVLLVQARAEQFGFEIRSLQEFMAAWELTSRSEAVVEARLSQIARGASFRNVFLFAASKAFTAMSDLRDAIVDRICPSLNEAPGDEVARVTLAGSVLALELLEEGSALNQPKYARRLMELAVRLLERPTPALHIRLSRIAEPGVEDVLRHALESRLQSAITREQLAAWHALLELTDRTWAREIADMAWPTDSDKQRSILHRYRQSREHGGPWSHWIRRQISANLDHFPPHFLLEKHLPPALTGKTVEVPDPLDALAAFSTALEVRLRISIRGSASSLHPSAYVISVDAGRGAPEVRHIASMAKAPPGWAPWVAAARFAASPSAHTLAEALSNMSRCRDHSFVPTMTRSIPWPLTACLRMAEDAEGLQSLSHIVDAGEFGDYADWEHAEQRWTRDGVEIDLLSSPVYQFPFIVRGQVHTISPFSFFTSRSRPHPEATALTQELIHQFLNTTAPDIREHLARSTLRLLEARSPTTTTPDVCPDLVEALSEASGWDFPLAAIADFIDWTDSSWIEVLDRIGRQPRRSISNKRNPNLLRSLVAAYKQNPSRAGLIHLIAQNLLMWRGPANLVLPHITPATLDTPHLRSAACLVSLARSDITWTEVDEFVRIIMDGTTYDESIGFDAAAMIEVGSMSASLKERALLNLGRGAHDGDVQQFVIDTLDQIARRKSGLDDPATWDRLQLPLPRPQPRGASIPPPPPPSPQFETLQLDNLRLFDTLHIRVTPRDDGLGQWLVFLGENGVGKSTLLRAIVFALASDDITTALLAQSYARWRHHPSPADDIAKIVVKTHDGRFTAEIEHGLERDALRPSSHESPQRPLVFAYGCRRGSALGGPDRETDLSPLASVATLFDEPAHLIHAETWLKDRALAAEQEKQKDPPGPRTRLFHAVLEALKRVLPQIDHIEIRDRRVWVRGPAVGEAPFSALSDGYLTTAGWVLDLIARWVERTEIREGGVPENFLDLMTGVVLVDEIDLYLHPTWQREVIERTRKLFPRMTFIVTTHNPLTLFGAQPSEIYVLRRKEQPDRSGAIGVRQIDLPKGVRADQILTGPWFGLESVLEPETLGLLEEHRRLLARQDPEAEARRRELEATLRERLGTFADTALDRLALSVAAELMTKDFRELTPEDRAKFRDEVKRRVEERRRRTGQSN